MKVVIIGSGIAGLALGAILQKNGFDISIHERNCNFDSKGHAFLMHPDAMDVLSIIARYNPDHEIPGQVIDRVILKGANNSDIQTSELDSWICMKRVDIVKYLSSFFRPEHIRYGHEFSHFLYENDIAVGAVFTNGDIEYGDIFIGADGAHSKVRNQILGQVDFTPVEVKEVVGVIKNKTIANQYQNRFTKYLSDTKGVSCGIIPCSDEELVWFMQFDVTLETYPIDTPEQLRELCYSLLESFPAEVKEILDHNDFSNNYVWRSTDFDLLPAFSRSNVMLIGDAAHLALPFTSAGTTNALVDAQLLANLLMSDKPVEEISRTFYNERAGSLKEHIKLGRNIKEKFLQGTNAGIVLPLISQSIEKPIRTKKANIEILYFTDPVCSTCWLVQPQLRKLALTYGQYFEISYHMGGLLPDWETYTGSKIKKPADAAIHWKEMAEKHPMPISPDVWLNSPLASSFPPSIAIKAAQLQSKVKAFHYHRRIKELLFLESKNITDIELLMNVASEVGLNTDVFIADISQVAVKKFEEDLILATKLNVSVLPTFIITNEWGEKITLKGYQEFEALEKAITDLYPLAAKDERKRDVLELFRLFPSLTTFEFSFLINITNEEASEQLQTLASKKMLTGKTNKTGTVWRQTTVATG
jgi:predicted DsbA family dithiol-disulfide isomerase/2-polyprenyl-6-methoxyphenol hydroxylase-like FAD-dependent oxidoreductase